MRPSQASGTHQRDEEVQLGDGCGQGEGHHHHQVPQGVLGLQVVLGAYPENRTYNSILVLGGVIFLPEYTKLAGGQGLMQKLEMGWLCSATTSRS